MLFTCTWNCLLRRKKGPGGTLVCKLLQAMGEKRQKVSCAASSPESVLSLVPFSRVPNVGCSKPCAPKACSPPSPESREPFPQALHHQPPMGCGSPLTSGRGRFPGWRRSPPDTTSQVTCCKLNPEYRKRKPCRPQITFNDP